MLASTSEREHGWNELRRSPRRVSRRPATTGVKTCAAYRFLGNDEVSWEGILAPHWEHSQERVREHSVVLCIQDTTELDFNGQEADGLQTATSR